jgi:formyl-CoA transferase
MRKLQAHKIMAGAVANGKDLAEDPHYASRDFAYPVPTPEAGDLYLARPGFRLTRTPAILRCAPNFAEHTDEVLGDLLGFSADEIRQMEEVKATTREPIIS